MQRADVVAAAARSPPPHRASRQQQARAFDGDEQQFGGHPPSYDGADRIHPAGPRSAGARARRRPPPGGAASDGTAPPPVAASGAPPPVHARTGAADAARLAARAATTRRRAVGPRRGRLHRARGPGRATRANERWAKTATNRRVAADGGTANDDNGAAHDHDAPDAAADVSSSRIGALVPSSSRTLAWPYANRRRRRRRGTANGHAGI